MPLTRRAFIRGLGLALGSLALARCAPPGPTASPGDAARDRLRDAWLSLDKLAKQTEKNADRGSETRDRLSADHQSALDELVAAGALAQPVAADLQAAFDDASNHVWRANAPITCYEPTIVTFRPGRADDLIRQAELLAELAGRGDIPPEAIAAAQSAITRDVAFLALTWEEEQALYTRLIEASQAGAPIPSFDQLALDIPPDAAQAARFMVALFSTE